MRYTVPILLVLLCAARFVRYGIKPDTTGYAYYKLDRWTGSVARCTVLTSC